MFQEVSSRRDEGAPVQNQRKKLLNASQVHPASLSSDELAAQCKMERLKRSGPGGQHRNKVETAIRLVHHPTGVRAEASERRSQGENRCVALARLRVNLALEVRQASGQPGRPSPLWQSRCLGGRVHVNPSHEDFATILAEALDAIAASDADVRLAAETLGTSASQLVRLLKKEPRALDLVNGWRAEHGLRPLR